MIDLYLNISSPVLFAVSAGTGLFPFLERLLFICIKKGIIKSPAVASMGKWLILISFPAQFFLFLYYCITLGHARMVGIICGLFFLASAKFYKRYVFGILSNIIFIAVVIRFVADLL